MATKKDRQEEPESPSNGAGIPVVGIGASAGGIGALKTLVPLLAPDAGLAYIVVQHLDPAHDSALASLLARLTKLPVVEIKDRTTDRVRIASTSFRPTPRWRYQAIRLQLGPPSKHHGERMTDRRLLRLARPCQGRERRRHHPVGHRQRRHDRAARDQGAWRARRVAQDDAEYDGMMRSAVAHRHGRLRAAAGEDAGASSATISGISPWSTAARVRTACGRRRPTILRRSARCCARRTGHDFSGYKDKTVVRRVQRRMQVLQIDEVPDFIERLRTRAARGRRAAAGPADRRHQLLPRSPGLRGAGTRGHPEALRGQGAGRHGPRLGARLLDRRGGLFDCHPAARAHAEGAERAQLQIFASDIDEQALQVARVGRFPATIAAESRRRGWSATSYARTAPTACQRAARDRACSPRTICCAMRRSPSSTWSPAAIC